MNKVWQVVCDVVCSISEKCGVRPLPPPEDDEYLKWLKAQKKASESAIREHRRRRRDILDYMRQGDKSQ